MEKEKVEGEQSNRRKTLCYLLYFFFISVLIHLIIVCGVFRYSFQRRIVSFFETLTQHSTPQEKIMQEQQRAEKRKALMQALQALADAKRTRPAKLVAPKSNFGWVMFDSSRHSEATGDNPMQHKPTEIPTTDGAVIEAGAHVATEMTPKKVIAQQEEKIVEHVKTIEAIEKTEAKVVQESKVIEQKSIPEGVTDRIEEIKAFQEKIDAFDPNEQKTVATPATKAASVTIEDGQDDGQEGVRVRGAFSDKPKRNLIALTKGYIEKLDGEDGTDLVDRDGDPNLRPSLEEYKYLMYESKLSWCIQAAWKQNFHYKPTKQYEGDAVVEFSLDHHGNLIHCNLLQSTGHKELDEMILKNMKFASPYPPIPKHFNTKTYTTGRHITVRTDRLGF